MKRKKNNSNNFWKLMGVFALIVVSGVGTMTVIALQPQDISGTFVAEMAEIEYHRSLYQASNYTTGCNHDGDPYIYRLGPYEGSTVNITLTPKVLGIDSIYLMRISVYYWGIDDQGPVNYLGTFGSWIKNPDKDVIKISEYDLPTNVVPLGTLDIPESGTPDATWWLVCFCADMGYRGGPDNNPDGKVIIDIVVV